MGTIYKIENIVNGKVYIGQAGNWKRRKRDHLSYLKHNKHPNKHLQSSWNKYGEQAFTFTLLVDDLPEKYMDDVERGLIATFRTTNPQFGYNKESGGNLNKKLSPEAIEKMRQAKQKWYEDGNVAPMKGKKHSPESLEKMRQKRSEEAIENMKQAQILIVQSPDYKNPMKGKKPSPEQIEKQRQALKKYYANGNVAPMKGKKHSPESLEKMRQKRSEEAIEKMRQAQILYAQSPDYKNPRQRKIIDSEGIIWPSIKSFCKVYDLNQSQAHRYLNTGKPYKGIVIKYYEESIQQSI
jgi:group I intron endonuclease